MSEQLEIGCEADEAFVSKMINRSQARLTHDADELHAFRQDSFKRACIDDALDAETAELMELKETELVQAWLGSRALLAEFDLQATN